MSGFGGGFDTGGGGGGAGYGGSGFGGGGGGGGGLDADASPWARLRPLTLLLGLGLLLMLLGGADEVRFSLAPTAALPARAASPCGVPFYTSALQRPGGLPAADAARLHAAVHRDADARLRERCGVEREKAARLDRGAHAWISLESSRRWYAAAAERHAAQARDCADWAALARCVRDQRRRR